MIRLHAQDDQQSWTVPAVSFAEILTLFFLSGFSGLIYEVVWLRMFVRAFGSTTFATSTILAVCMFGFAAGARAEFPVPAFLKGAPPLFDAAFAFI
jgi:predicted membrane-bound spermidine synthase